MSSAMAERQALFDRYVVMVKIYGKERRTSPLQIHPGDLRGYELHDLRALHPDMTPSEPTGTEDEFD